VRRTRARVAVAAAACAVAAVWGAAARPARAADSCGKPDLVDMVPPDGATGVPLNATLGAHYQASADYLGEDVVLVRPGGEEQALTGTFDATEGLLSVTPTEPLLAGGAYTVRWPALRGLNAAAPGLGGEASFTAGAADDTEAPTFDGVTAISWDFERAQNDCLDALEERFVFDLRLGAADDDGGRDALTLIVFQTAGPQIAGKPVAVSTRAIPAAGDAARVKLPPGQAVGHVCFAALVRDTTGKVSASGDVESCVQTPAPPFFQGCSVAGAGGGATTALGALASVALAALMARRGSRGRGVG
jgi:hypothetical protein